MIFDRVFKISMNPFSNQVEFTNISIKISWDPYLFVYKINEKYLIFRGNKMTVFNI